MQAEIDKFSVGASTNFMIVQDQAFLAQARLSLDRALGNLLEENTFILDDSIRDGAR